LLYKVSALYSKELFYAGHLQCDPSSSCFASFLMLRMHMHTRVHHATSWINQISVDSTCFHQCKMHTSKKLSSFNLYAIRASKIIIVITKTADVGGFLQAWNITGGLNICCKIIQLIKRMISLWKEAIMCYHKIDIFCCQQRWMAPKGGHGKFIKNALCLLRYVKRHLLGWSDVEW